MPRSHIVRVCTFQSIIAASAFIVLSFLAFSGTISAAVFTVTKTADTNDGVCDADCSLREALAAARSAPSDDTIEFDSLLFSTPQTISVVDVGFATLSATGAGALTINGPGADLLTISGTRSTRVMVLGATGLVTLNGVTIADGSVDSAKQEINLLRSLSHNMCVEIYGIHYNG
jgi:CSLREA domain-containing protein